MGRRGGSRCAEVEARGGGGGGGEGGGEGIGPDASPFSAGCRFEDAETGKLVAASRPTL